MQKSFQPRDERTYTLIGAHIGKQVISIKIYMKKKTDSKNANKAQHLYIYLWILLSSSLKSIRLTESACLVMFYAKYYVQTHTPSQLRIPHLLLTNTIENC